MADDTAHLQNDLAEIPAPSRPKVMDWSLVLASQSIAHFIASPDESGRWSLRVAPEDLPRAQTAIRLFEAENRALPWQQPVLAGRLIFDWGALVWVVALIIIHALAGDRPVIKDAGIMHGDAVAQGEWWRLVTATQLHADGGHLASNLTIGFVLLGLVMGRWGTATGLLAALLAGIGGNAVNWWLQAGTFGLGASGVVMGCIGLLAFAPTEPMRGQWRIWKSVLVSVGGAVMLFMLLGLDPRADVLGHAGGFVSGLVLGVILQVCPGLRRARAANIAAAFLLVSLVLLSWILALTHAPAPR